ncbi:CocE/NonD family hydrolase [Sphingomonas colocasiae]|uniref:CocE/NonD family hydrolase n=1 Tax=Sphingomonas colocasiae TaxID=1848973 RepID=A0ABS7PYM2_9SPHN|nr:CocE/NonD family hydrolase [Sphingomonas colocasiae]MBY8826401.1 CocE/NonD family hydrolase [Sphingomonas colocasiae]
MGKTIQGKSRRARLGAASLAALLLLSTGAGAQPAPAVPGKPLRQLFDLRTPMRDGVELSSDVWLPEADGRYPVILIRTPYVKTDPMSAQAVVLGRYFAEHGYAVVVQDVRGRGDSDGKFDFYFQEAADGHDSVEQLAAQPWSNGRVCMMGVSYLGAVQWLAAKERPPHLACIAPTSPSGSYQDELPRTGGAFMMMWALMWLNETSGHVSQGGNMGAADLARVFSHRPLLTMDEAFGRRMPLFRKFVEHDLLDDYWKRIQLGPDDFAGIDIPVLATTGWFDGDQEGTLHYWRGMEARAGSAKHQYLTIGPWNHMQSYTGGAEKIGELALSRDSIIDNKAVHLAFFDRYLKQTTSHFDRPHVRLFVSGRNVWRDFDTFPLREATETRLYLSSGGAANSAAGNGALGWAKPARAGRDTYLYDPKNPVPLNLNAELFAGDRKQAQSRPDVLVYTSPPLEKVVEVIGPVAMELFAASDAKDTDFTAAISDVGPDGKAILLGSKPVGIIRARYRHGPMAQPSLLTPGKAERYRINLGAIGHAFLPGHRIRVEISSSAFPMFNPNQNTGNPIATDTEWKNANQTIFHGGARASALILPVYAGKDD